MLATSSALEKLPSTKRRVMNQIPLKERLIVALDVASVDKARQVVDELGDEVLFYKIGMQLQFAHGLEFAQELISKYEKKVFLDSKLLDIGPTIKGAVQNIARMGVTFLTVHGNGDSIRAAIEGRKGTDLKILSVTLLTTLDAHDLKDLYGDIGIDVEGLVKRRAKKAFDAGADGVIASGQEASMIREIAGDALAIVAPGIRPDGSEINEQKRVMTPRDAIAAGADYLVVGRPILQATDRKAMAQKIFDEMKEGLAARKG